MSRLGAEEGTVFLSDFTGAADFFGAGLAAGEDLVDLAAGLGAGFLGAGLAAGFLGGDFFGEGFDGFTGGFFVGDFFAAGFFKGFATGFFFGAGAGFLVFLAMMIIGG